MDMILNSKKIKIKHNRIEYFNDNEVDYIRMFDPIFLWELMCNFYYFKKYMSKKERQQRSALRLPWIAIQGPGKAHESHRGVSEFAQRRK